MSDIQFDEMFMSMANLIAMKSKDTSTHCGAVIVGPDNEVRSTGYNSFVRGINDDDPERLARPEKYLWVEHAERNAIYNAARMGTSTRDCVLFSTLFPCMDCARAIVQAGIKKVVYMDPEVSINAQEWLDIARQRVPVLFSEAGVSYVEYDGPLIQTIQRQVNGVQLSCEHFHSGSQCKSCG